MSWDWEKLKAQQQGKGNIDLSPKKKKFDKKFDISNSWIVPVAYVLLALVLIVICWYVARWTHYKFSYEVKMKQAIIEMVKPEALKDEYRKEVPGGS